MTFRLGNRRMGRKKANSTKASTLGCLLFGAVVLMLVGTVIYFIVSSLGWYTVLICAVPVVLVGLFRLYLYARKLYDNVLASRRNRRKNYLERAIAKNKQNDPIALEKPNRVTKYKYGQPFSASGRMISKSGELVHEEYVAAFVEKYTYEGVHYDDDDGDETTILYGEVKWRIIEKTCPNFVLVLNNENRLVIYGGGTSEMVILRQSRGSERSSSASILDISQGYELVFVNLGNPFKKKKHLQKTPSLDETRVIGAKQNDAVEVFGYIGYKNINAILPGKVFIAEKVIVYRE